MSKKNRPDSENSVTTRILKSRDNPIMLPTGLMIRGTSELLIINFVDSEAEKIISSVALTKNLATDIRQAVEEFLIEEIKDEE